MKEFRAMMCQRSLQEGLLALLVVLGLCQLGTARQLPVMLLESAQSKASQGPGQLPKLTGSESKPAPSFSHKVKLSETDRALRQAGVVNLLASLQGELSRAAKCSPCQLAAASSQLQTAAQELRELRESLIESQREAVSAVSSVAAVPAEVVSAEPEDLPD